MSAGHPGPHQAGGITVYRQWGPAREARPAEAVRTVTCAIGNEEDGFTWAGTVELATTRLQWVCGLQRHAPLEEHEGMLFCFPAASETLAVWMQGMTYPLDVAFISAERVVVGLERHVSYDPAEPSREYRTPSPAQYVLETAAGGLRDVQVGDQVVWGEGPSDGVAG